MFELQGEAFTIATSHVLIRVRDMDLLLDCLGVVNIPPILGCRNPGGKERGSTGSP
jgi:hypothetical protein